MKKRIAIISPARDAYSESFIQAHRQGLDEVVAYYYGGHMPRLLDGQGSIQRLDWKTRIKRRLDGPGLSLEADDLMYSLGKEKIDVVLAEYGPTGSAVAEACSAMDLPLVVHFHGYDASKHSVLEKYRDGYERMFKIARSIVVVSKAMYRMMLDFGAPKQKLVLNHYGPDPRFAGISERPKDFTGFLSIGRFVDKKAPYYTLYAFKELLSKGYDTTLTMAGDGPLLPACRNLSRLWGIADKVKFLGAADRDMVVELISKKACFVQHSIRAEDGDMEGTPVAILEAGSAGMPIVSTRHAGIPDVVEHGDTGLLVDEHDVHGLAQHMVDVFTDYDSALAMGRRLKRHIDEHHSMEQSLNRLQRIIDGQSLE